MQLEVHLDPFREPRGFIKLLQWFFGVCAFATCLNFTTEYGFDVNCRGKDGSNVTVSIKNRMEYPFAVDHSEVFSLPAKCEEGGTLGWVGNAASDAQYLVAVGVISVMWSMVAAAVYLLVEAQYKSRNLLPAVDFGATLLLAIMWISASGALSKGISNLSTASDVKEWIFEDKNSICATHGCSNFYAGSFARLVVTVLFGVINFILWGGNLWFLYKETAWFESIVRGRVTTTNINSEA